LDRRFLLGFIGIPSVGKTTFAKKLAKKFAEEGHPIIVIGSDDIRNMIPNYNENFDPEREPIIREITLNLIKNCLELGFNVINDDLNYYKSMRHDLFEIANSKNCQFLTIFFKIPLKTALKRNEKRGLPIPNSVIQNIYEKLDVPGEYGWDDPIETIEVIDFGAVEEINQVYSKITSQLKKEIVEKNKIKKTKPGKAESLDKITRQLINKLISKQIHKEFNKELSILRKQFLFQAKKENYNLDQVKSVFSRQLEEFIRKYQPEE